MFDILLTEGQAQNSNNPTSKDCLESVGKE